jgi:hypothetical protein
MMGSDTPPFRTRDRTQVGESAIALNFVFLEAEYNQKNTNATRRLNDCKIYSQ